nr:lysophospholipid acyltransferase family protein [Brachybacterium equifaecis]
MVRLIWRPRVTGLEHFPRSGGVIVASNHLANVDSFLIPVIAPRHVRFVSKDDFWKQPGLKGRAQKWFMNTVGTIPLDRATMSSGQGVLKVALEVLKSGEVFGIYPEGHRSKDGLLHKGLPGAAWLAHESGCPVIPLGLKGTDKLFRDGSILPSAHRAEAHFGAPVDFSDIPADLPVGARRRLMTERIMQEIQKLSGQERAQS